MMLIKLVLFSLVILRGFGGGQSLWPEGRQKSIFTDTKPQYINDRIVVVIYETAEGVNKATTKSDKDLKTTGKFAAKALPLDLGYTSGYGGAKQTTRHGRIMAKVCAKVINRLDNGYLQIKGRKFIRINNEEEIIEVSGIVNPDDISEDGSIVSTRLIDARIEYKGRLKFSDKERPGFFARLISRLINILF